LALLDDADTAVGMVDTPFTLADLRAVYEAFGNVPLDISAFNKRMLQPDGFLIPGSERVAGHRGPPARTYTRGSGASARGGRLPVRKSSRAQL
jgi:8-oxo-dGTP diphosphatase